MTVENQVNQKNHTNQSQDSEWKSYKLGEIVEIKYGKDHKKLDDGDIPVYGSGGLMRYANDFIYDKESILIPRKGTLSNLFYLNEPFWSVDTMFYTKIKETVFPKYLYYYLKGQDLVSLNVGSAVPSLTTEVLNKFEVTIPDSLETQKEIASILSSLDEKIELNQQMNETLEAIGQGIFKEWFVNFNFPGFDGELVDGLPKDWKIGKLGNEFNLIMGQSPPGDSYNEKGEGEIFFQGRTDFGFRFPQKRMYTTQPSRRAKKLDTLVSVRAPVGDINMALEECCIGRGLSSIRHKSGAYSYTYYYMKFLEKIFNGFESEGTVFGSINKFNFENIEVIIPSKEVINGFEIIVNSLDEKILNNSLEIQTLIQLRDNLLPRLMNGKLSLPLINLME